MRFKRVTTQQINKREALHEYRKRNLVFFVLFLGWVPFGVCVVGPLGRYFNSEGLARALVTVWFMAIAASAIWRLNWICPRCGKKFYTKWWYKNVATLKCVNCGYRPGE
jgi:ribosomal protein S27AE